jgi:hypothetical protein
LSISTSAAQVAFLAMTARLQRPCSGERWLPRLSGEPPAVCSQGSSFYYKIDLFKSRKVGTKFLYKRLLDQALISWG